MSRIGNRIITVPAGVTVELNNNVVTVKGPKGELNQVMLKDITMKQEENTIILERKNENAKAMHGTMNALISNMIKGVSEGYAKNDEIPKVLNGLGIAIISTSKGIMTDKEARKENIGGEVLAYIW